MTLSEIETGETAPHPGEPDLLPSAIEDQIRASVRSAADARFRWLQAVRGYDESSDTKDAWHALGRDLDLFDLFVPEIYGGSGAGMRIVAAVAEELGRQVVPVPFISSAVLSTAILLAAGAHDDLARLRTGECIAGLVAAPTDVSLAPRVAVEVSAAGLTGTARSAVGVDVADLLLVPAMREGRVELHAVERGATGVRVEVVPSLDMTRPVADVVLTDAPSRLLAVDGRSAVDAGLLAGAVALAAEQSGIASWCLETTLAHVKERRQFGRAIGSYQAIKHRLADLWAAVGRADATARYAADAYDRGTDVDIAVHVAQATCGPIAVTAAEECLQLHGGIGMTWEFPVHLYLKRAKADSLWLGTASAHRAALGPLVGLSPS